MLPLYAAVAVLALLLPAAPARAQAPVDSETRQLIDRLRPGDARTRGIRMPGADSPASVAPAPTGPALTGPAGAPPLQAVPAPTAQAPRETTAPPGAAAVSIMVNFSSGSAVLSPRSAEALDALGRALASAELAPFGFRIEGHTDTVGDAGQNMQLSRRRAEAVRAYLMKRHGVEPARLAAIGLGESQPLVPTPDQVNEPRNRRVQVVNTGG